jgi:glycosyltransferase involved in cell wall biosynthesis
VKFSIITPSFRNSEWLKLCIASVADQDIEHEHIIQDACSDDGTQEWLPHDPRVKAFIEKDRGMYDAVNRGFARAQGDYLAYLNCDEQYLPGALRKVVHFFEAHPDVDVVFSDTVVVDAAGKYICDRKAIVPQRAHTLLGGNLSFLTCSTFLRRRVITEHRIHFNPEFRDIGDVEWTLRLISKNLRMAVLREFTSVFTETGSNMNLLENARREKRDFLAAAPQWVQRMRPLLIAHFRMRRLFGGAYRTHPYEYSIYTRESPDRRQTFAVTNPTFRWVRPAAIPEPTKEAR